MMVKEFKDFIMRGNLLEIAVAFIMGIAFAAVVTSFTNDIVMALVGVIVGEPNFGNLTLEIGDGVINYGLFINAVINFLLIALVLFFIMKAAAKMMEKVKRGEEPEPETASMESQLLTEIRDLLARREGQIATQDAMGTTPDRTP